jgi:hypothetical protein
VIVVGWSSVSKDSCFAGKFIWSSSHLSHFDNIRIGDNTESNQTHNFEVFTFHRFVIEGAGLKIDNNNPQLAILTKYNYYPNDDSRTNLALYTRVDPSAAPTYLNGSSYATYKFHDLVPETIIFAVAFNDDLAASDVRDLQSQLICDVVNKDTNKTNDYFLAGSFGQETNENYPKILKKCALKNLANLYGKSPKSRLHVQLIESFSVPVNKSYPVTLNVVQPLSKHWEIFEIAFAVSAADFVIIFFVWLISW